MNSALINLAITSHIKETQNILIKSMILPSKNKYCINFKIVLP